ncbi:hypothetical protein HNO86_20190 [Pseudomonas sp. C1C7]|uniref:hypothetical protein n=1 Tax=Pseudomonas sp. C1C7 TaxID=2735272 RepID=UPI001816270A|nr:hypothetical protein [Pseudomonas sp. C1C7]NUT77369.1 hypothetical protein [Pseudomonas sp. C1C7]
MFAIVVNDDAGCLVPRGVLACIASKLGSYSGLGYIRQAAIAGKPAPTGFVARHKAAGNLEPL